MNRKKEALKHLHIEKTILLEFEPGTGYRNPILKDVVDRILYIEQNNNNYTYEIPNKRYLHAKIK
jgi:hypothetical protein